MVAALFIQYISYSVFYIMDQHKEMAPKYVYTKYITEKIVDDKPKPPPKADAKKGNDKIQKEGGEPEPKKEDKKKADPKPKKEKPPPGPKMILRPPKAEEEKEYVQWEDDRMKSITNEIVENYHK